MSDLTTMREQLAFLQEELKRHPKPFISWMITAVHLENAIWVLEQRIKEAERLEPREVKPRTGSILRKEPSDK